MKKMVFISDPQGSVALDAFMSGPVKIHFVTSGYFKLPMQEAVSGGLPYGSQYSQAAPKMQSIPCWTVFFDDVVETEKKKKGAD